MTNTSVNSKSIKRHDIKDKTVLVRVDYNVPMDPGTTNIADDSRILASIPQIEYLLDRNCKVILLSHLGRPNSSSDTEFSMRPITTRLSEILGNPVLQLPSCKGKDVENQINQLPQRSVSMLENIRFDAGETKNDVMILLENTAGQKNSVGYGFEQLGEIFNQNLSIHKFIRKTTYSIFIRINHANFIICINTP